MTEGREIELETWKRFAEDDPLSHRVLQQILAGVSTHPCDFSES